MQAESKVEKFKVAGIKMQKSASIEIHEVIISVDILTKFDYSLMRNMASMFSFDLNIRPSF
jgi:hypothetical protein